MKTLYLVACAKTKTLDARPAKDLYLSPLFQASRAAAERFGDRWLILSALHGVLEPEEVVAPYDVTLVGKLAPELRAWAIAVAAWHGWGSLPKETVIVFLAGRDYSYYLRWNLAYMGFTIAEPLRKMGIGRRIQALRTAVQTGQMPPLHSWSWQEPTDPAGNALPIVQIHARSTTGD